MSSSSPRAARPRHPVRALALLLVLAALPGVAGSTPAGASSSAVVADASTPARSPYRLPVPGTGAAGVAPTRADLVASGVLVRDFDAPDVRWAAGHRGVDLAHSDHGDVVAPADGTVTFSGTVVDRPLVVLVHPDGLRSTLEPVASELVPGDRVTAGSRVGTVAPVPTNHCAPATCVHWGVRRGEAYLDPLALLGVREPIILLPLGPG